MNVCLSSPKERLMFWLLRIINARTSRPNVLRSVTCSADLDTFCAKRKQKRNFLALAVEKRTCSTITCSKSLFRFGSTKPRLFQALSEWMTWPISGHDNLRPTVSWKNPINTDDANTDAAYFNAKQNYLDFKYDLKLYLVNLNIT